MPSLEPIHNFIFTDHALKEMARREITQEDVKAVLAQPEQTEMVRAGRAVYQSRLGLGEPPKMYLLSFEKRKSHFEPKTRGKMPVF